MVRLLIFSLSLFIGSNALAAECGLFRVVKGKVTYKKKNKAKFKKARINKKVCQGDTVKTSENSRAKIVMADQNELNISPNSELLIEVYKNAKNGDKQVLLDVVYGKVRSNVKQKYKDNKRSHYRVKTKSAVAGVRGTEFMASFNAATSESKIVTFEGEVMVGQMESGQFVPQVSVKPGQFTSNSPGTAPHPAEELPPQELAQMDRETNMSDSPRDVSSDASKEAPKEEPKKDEAGNKEGAKQEPKADKPNQNGPDGDKKAGGPRPDGAKGPNAQGPDVDGPDSEYGIDEPASGEGRGIASVGPEGGDSMGLPPPTMDDMPEGDGFDGNFNPPNIPSLDPIIDTVPDCLTCNDAIINQKVRVTIIPTLE